MVERVPLLRPAGTTTEEDPPGVVDLAQTSTELLEVWAPVQPPKTEAPDWQLFVEATEEVGEKEIKETKAAATHRSFRRSTHRSIQEQVDFPFVPKQETREAN